MAFLSEQGDIGGLEETAVAALRWFHERPDLEPAEEREPHTMTDAEIIARVRLLVGGRDVARAVRRRPGGGDASVGRVVDAGSDRFGRGVEALGAVAAA